MKTLYQAASAIEAHMLLNLLQREGLSAQVRGEHLQGAIGELPAAGLVRLEIPESEYVAARAVIDRWESKNPTEVTTPPQRQPHSRLVIGAVIGLTIGVGASYAVFRSPMAVDGIDYNSDGVLDEK